MKYFSVYIIFIMHKTRRQHYVPRTYLRGWAEKEKLYCLRDNHVFSVSIENIAQKRDYYRLEPLNSQALSLINTFISKAPIAIKAQFEEIVSLLSVIPISYEEIKKKGEDKELFRKIDVMVNNTIENLYSSIEGKATPCLNCLRSGNLEFWKDEELFLDFITFVILLFTRTPKKEMEAKKCMEAIYHSGWRIISIIVALGVTYNINANYEKWKITLLINNTQTPFITSDQPVINLSQIHGEKVTEFVAYMPISPLYSVIIAKDDNGDRLIYNNITENDVKRYNQRMKEESSEILLSNNDEILKEFMGNSMDETT